MKNYNKTSNKNIRFPYNREDNTKKFKWNRISKYNLNISIISIEG